ncbi:ANTAR domain-containing protein [Streptomyces sp. NPDC048415]|uniref:ANTAR domain-containing protein n=1 Tax=Streptomyces sp. NPDC048415 TaxID=3154822 RepID=UPI0034340F36
MNPSDTSSRGPAGDSARFGLPPEVAGVVDALRYHPLLPHLVKDVSSGEQADSVLPVVGALAQGVVATGGGGLALDVLQRLSEGRGRESVGHTTSPAPIPLRGRNGVEIPSDARRPARPPLSDKSELPTAEQAEELCEETEQFQEALERPPVIDIARSVLMSVWPCTEDDAWCEILVDVSQSTNTSCMTWLKP